MTEIKLKRAYDPASPDDGYRIYIDRLWPRGLSHETFHYDLWMKDIAPSTDLREWFHADPDSRWPEFRQRYAAELKAGGGLDELRQAIAGHPVVTLIYSSRDEARNNADILKELLS